MLYCEARPWLVFNCADGIRLSVGRGPLSGEADSQVPVGCFSGREEVGGLAKAIEEVTRGNLSQNGISGRVIAPASTSGFGRVKSGSLMSKVVSSE